MSTHRRQAVCVSSPGKPGALPPQTPDRSVFETCSVLSQCGDSPRGSLSAAQQPLLAPGGPARLGLRQWAGSSRTELSASTASLYQEQAGQQMTRGSWFWWSRCPCLQTTVQTRCQQVRQTRQGLLFPYSPQLSTRPPGHYMRSVPRACPGPRVMIQERHLGIAF